MNTGDGAVRSRLRELARLFLRLGFTAFGGPAAHIAMMHDEAVGRLKWLTEQEFLDLMGATNLIPGPNSTQMALHLGFMRAGWRGMLVSGACFILPAAFLVGVLTWFYASYGETAKGASFLYGVKPAVIAVVLQALYMLGRKALRGYMTAAVAVLTAAGYFLGLNEILLIVLGGLAVLIPGNFKRLSGLGMYALAFPLAVYGVTQAAEKEHTLSTLALVFLKIGSVLYGSGYVLLAFLETDFVGRLGWLTTKQLVDVVAIGQVTPGPLLTTATSIGYLTAGVPGAVVATAAIFLPSFLFVAMLYPLVARVRKSPVAGALLDGVNAASLGLMAAVTVQLARAAVIDALTAAVLLASAAALYFLRVNSTWLIAGGGLVGVLSGVF